MEAAVVMEDWEDFSLSGLEKRNYRFLQKKAKALGLPSNVKKVYLIQLIHTKIFGAPGQVEAIIDQVNTERQLLSKRRNRSKKKRLQNTEISSTDPLYTPRQNSPAISLTPKLARPVVVYSPHRRSFFRLKQHGSPPQASQNKKSECSMVLRNRTQPMTNLRNIYDEEPSNTKRAIYDERDPLSVLKQLNEKKPEHLKVVIRKLETLPLKRRDPAGGHRPRILGGAAKSVQTDEVQTKSLARTGRGMRRPSCADMTPSPVPMKRPRALSGIYPLRGPEPEPAVTYQFVPGDIAIRYPDGTYSKINALVQRPARPSVNNDLDTIRSILRSTCKETTRNQTATDNNDCQDRQHPATPNTLDVTTPIIDTQITIQSNSFKRPSDETEPAQEEYCHKKIRSRRASELKREKEALPRIHEAFSNFNSVANDVTQPLYVQVTDGPTIIFPPPTVPSAPEVRLEALYNIVLTPRVSTAPLAMTRAVYCAPIISTPAEYTPTAYNAEPKLDSREQVDLHASDLYGCMISDQDLATRQDLSSPLSQLASQVSELPELVEDALELISQDGDYMERIGMESRADCVLCVWTGPACLLTSHVRKEHACRIHKLSSQEWNVTYQLSTVARASRCELLECVHTTALYALTARCRDPDTFVCEIQSLSPEPEPASTCTLTVFNRVTGEPLSWTGVVRHVSMPSGAGLSVHLTSLALLPNSARVYVLNGELLGNAGVTRQAELEDIQITVFVKI